MASTYARARQLAQQLVDEGVPAVVDVRDAPGVLPGVLIPPPRLTFDGYAGPTARWQLVALSSDTTGSADAWRQLDELVGRVSDVLPVELADPSSYQLGASSHPAYLITLTESLGD